MTDRLFRLVYHSRNLIAGPERAREEEIGRILAVSRDNNAMVDVTGALLFSRDCFAQVLEGGRAALEATFERIQRDERHGDALVLQFEEASQRRFGRWSMAYRGRLAGDRALFRHLDEIGPAAPDVILATLESLVRAEERLPA